MSFRNLVDYLLEVTILYGEERLWILWNVIKPVEVKGLF